MSSRSLPSVRRQGLALCQVLSLGLVAMSVQAQTPAVPAAQAATSAAAAADPKAPMSDVDRAKRDADKVFQWIKFHAEKGEKKPAHETKAEAPKPVARPVAAAAPAPVARRQELDPAAERALAARSAAQDAAPVVATASPTPAPIGQPAAQTNAPTNAQTIAPPTGVPQPMSEAPSPQVVSMAAPSTAPVAKTPEPEPDDEPVPLKLLHKVDPEYPRALLAQQRAGSVLVQFTVRPDGGVDAAQALRSPDRKLSAAAINAVKQWRFGPIPAPRQVSVEIGFQVD
ncbi:TonB family protein [Roseateles sp.]|uniref:energy transducer TonB n=1 Tax=Roseateles sp. TaxID=1971397 RepID=UPI002F429548